MAGNKNSGRPKGSKNRLTTEVAEKIADNVAAFPKKKPLEIMMEIASDYNTRYRRMFNRLAQAAGPEGMIDLVSGEGVALLKRLERLAEMALKASSMAAPYAHPRLIATWDHEGGFPEDFDFGRLNSRQLGQLIEQVSDNQEPDGDNRRVN